MNSVLGGFQRTRSLFQQPASLTASVIGNFAGFSDWRIATRAFREGPGEGDVAPGIPEALFATAMGLAAAIPGRYRLRHDHRRSRPLCRAYARADRTIGGVLARGFGLISITRRAATTTD
jgi:hypothetical protein